MDSTLKTAIVFSPQSLLIALGVNTFLKTKNANWLLPTVKLGILTMENALNVSMNLIGSIGNVYVLPMATVPINIAKDITW